MFNGNTGKLKFKKKSGNFENSSKTCRIEKQNDNTYRGYSYAQIIFYYDSKLKLYVFNSYKYSNTTNKHQRILLDYLDNGIKPYIKVRATTLNDGFKFEVLELCEENIKIIEKYFPKKLKSFKKDLENKILEEKQEKSFRLTNKKIDRLDFKTKKGLDNALKKVNRDFSNINYTNNFSKFIHLLDLGYDIKNTFKNSFTRKPLNASIKDILKARKFYSRLELLYLTQFDSRFNFNDLITSLKTSENLDDAIQYLSIDTNTLKSYLDSEYRGYSYNNFLSIENLGIILQKLGILEHFYFKVSNDNSYYSEKIKVMLDDQIIKLKLKDII